MPFWTKRKPDYGSMLKTINCRDDSLAGPGGMWASMKGRKRCVVLGEGFYEWYVISLFVIPCLSCAGWAGLSWTRMDGLGCVCISIVKCWWERVGWFSGCGEMGGTGLWGRVID